MNLDGRTSWEANAYTVGIWFLIIILNGILTIHGYNQHEDINGNILFHMFSILMMLFYIYRTKKVYDEQRNKR